MGRIIFIILFLIISGFTILVIVNDADAQSSSTWRTRVGNPPERGEPLPGSASPLISQTAINLVNALKSSCGGSVNSSNYPCAKSIFSGAVLHPDLSYNEITISAGTYGYLQCIGFVNAIVGGATGIQFPRVGNAADYDRNIDGFSFIPVGGTISVGDIVVWDNGGDGHIAVVVEVYDQNTIQTAEANFDFRGAVGFRNRVISSEPTIKGWLRKI